MIPKDGYIQYIVNPKSGASSSKRVVAQFKDFLVEKGYDVRVVFTRSLEHTCDVATQAAVDYQCAMVTASGGDGTLREVIHGLEGSDKLFMPIPGGTENLLANELGFDMHVQSLIDAFEGDCIKPLDIGTVNGKCFTCVSGFGFDGTVIHRINSERTGHINHMTYFWPLWRTFWEYDFPAMKVVADGVEIFNDRGLVFVGNTSRYAIGLSLCKDADYSDGVLDICIFRCHNQLTLMGHSATAIFKSHTKFKNVIYKRAKDIQITTEEKSPIFCQIDGDPGPTLPADIKIIPQAIRVLVPPGAKPAGIRTRLRRVIG
ncbi:MAG: diacylglycerol/lipid kinase family protein [Planctomycetota bacterium]|jgi:YegS/Rv2252/BmrU family lipid kinase